VVIRRLGQRDHADDEQDRDGDAQELSPPDVTWFVHEPPFGTVAHTVVRAG
jgi:hypothetical protein